MVRVGAEVGLIAEGKAILSLSTTHLWPQCHLVTLSVVTKREGMSATGVDQSTESTEKAQAPGSSSLIFTKP